MRISDLAHIIYDARRKMRKLVYDKNGNFKKGITKKQKRTYRRMHFALLMIATDKAEGRLVYKKGEELGDE